MKHRLTAARLTPTTPAVTQDKMTLGIRGGDHAARRSLRARFAVAAKPETGFCNVGLDP